MHGTFYVKMEFEHITAITKVLPVVFFLSVVRCVIAFCSMDGWIIHLIFENKKRPAEHKVIKPKTV
jgi:hypothetical protein